VSFIVYYYLLYVSHKFSDDLNEKLEQVFPVIYFEINNAFMCLRSKD
jgi:hypothetical protein